MFTSLSRVARSAVRPGRQTRARCESLEVRRLLAVVTAGDQFGDVAGKNTILRLPDGDGDIVSYSLTGGGTGQITDTGLALTGTTTKSKLTITVKRNGGDGLVTVPGISADGPLAAINAGTANIAGNVTLNGGTVTTTAAVAPAAKSSGGVAITLAEMQNGSIDTGGEAISTLRLQNWAASADTTQQVIAPWMGTLLVTGRKGVDGLPGDMGANVVLSDRNSSIIALNTATVAGTVSGIDAPGGGINSLTAGAINGTVSALFLGTVRTKAGKGEGTPDGSASGEIRAVGAAPQVKRASIGTVQITSANAVTIRADDGNLGNITIVRDVTDSNIFAGNGGAGTIKVGGIFSNSRIQTMNSVKSVALGGMADSNVLVGFGPDFAEPAPASNADFANGAATTALLRSFTAGKSMRGTVTPQITGTNNLSAAQLGSVSIANMDSTDPPALHISVLASSSTKNSSPASVTYTDNATTTNSFKWRRGQTMPTLLTTMLTTM